jgi:aerobic C4-dicarboxylate transport protein
MEPPRSARSKSLWRQLWFQVAVAVVIGIVLGHFAPSVGEQMKPLGDAFIQLVRMLIGPIIFCTVVHGIAGMKDMKRVGRVALKALIYFEVMTLIALVIGLVFVELWHPGAGMNVDARAMDTRSIAEYTTQAEHQNAAQFLLHMIPTTLISAFVQTDVLQVLVVSLLFGFALSVVGDRAKPVYVVVDGLSQILFRIVGFIMWTAPLGAFGAIAFTVGRFGAGALLSLGNLILEFYVASLVFVFVVLAAVARWAGFSIIKLIAYLREELIVVAATTSSETVLPQLIIKLEELGCEEAVVGLVIPTGYSFNLDGTCLYLTTAAVFLAQATNTPLSLGQELGLIAVLLLTSKGAAGVAGAAFVVLAATLASVGHIPVASIALILGIHRLLAEALTFVNVVGNCVATIVVAKWEGALDMAQLQATLGRGAQANGTLAMAHDTPPIDPTPAAPRSAPVDAKARVTAGGQST